MDKTNKKMDKIEELDKNVNNIFDNICKNGGFKFGGENDSYYAKNQRYFHLMNHELKLISPKMGRDMFLTDFGKKVCKRGGWLKHLYIEEKSEKRKELKEKFDFQTAKWKYYTFWLWFALAIFGGGYSTYDFIKRITTEESDQQLQNHKDRTELEESKSHTSTLNHENHHSFQNSIIVAF